MPLFIWISIFSIIRRTTQTIPKLILCHAVPRIHELHHTSAMTSLSPVLPIDYYLIERRNDRDWIYVSMFDRRLGPVGQRVATTLRRRPVGHSKCLAAGRCWRFQRIPLYIHNLLMMLQQLQQKSRSFDSDRISVFNINRARHNIAIAEFLNAYWI